MKYIYLLIYVILLFSCKSKNGEVIVHYPNANFDFGIKKNSDKIKGSFKIDNKGEEDLYIKSIAPGCECTVADFPKEPIGSNESRTIYFTYIPQKADTGSVHKEIIVRTNTVKQLQVLTITGKIIN